MPDEKMLGLLVQLPAVAVVVWLLVQQNKDRNRRDTEQNAMLREMVSMGMPQKFTSEPDSIHPVIDALIAARDSRK